MAWFKVLDFFVFFKNSIRVHVEIVLCVIYVNYIIIIYKSLNHPYNG